MKSLKKKQSVNIMSDITTVLSDLTCTDSIGKQYTSVYFNYVE